MDPVNRATGNNRQLEPSRPERKPTELVRPVRPAGVAAVLPAAVPADALQVGGGGAPLQQRQAGPGPALPEPSAPPAWLEGDHGSAPGAGEVERQAHPRLQRYGDHKGTGGASGARSSDRPATRASRGGAASATAQSSGKPGAATAGSAQGALTASAAASAGVKSLAGPVGHSERVKALKEGGLEPAGAKRGKTVLAGAQKLLEALRHTRNGHDVDLQLMRCAKAHLDFSGVLRDPDFASSQITLLAIGALWREQYNAPLPVEMVERELSPEGRYQSLALQEIAAGHVALTQGSLKADPRSPLPEAALPMADALERNVARLRLVLSSMDASARGKFLAAEYASLARDLRADRAFGREGSIRQIEADAIRAMLETHFPKEAAKVPKTLKPAAAGQ